MKYIKTYESFKLDETPPSPPIDDDDFGDEFKPKDLIKYKVNCTVLVDYEDLNLDEQIIYLHKDLEPKFNLIKYIEKMTTYLVTDIKYEIDEVKIDYSKLSNGELQNELNDAIDANDNIKLNIISKELRSRSSNGGQN